MRWKEADHAMAVVSYACLLLAAWYLWRWGRRSPDRNPLEARFPWVPLAVVTVVGAAFYVPTWRIDRAAARAGKAVSAVAGDQLEYRCGSVLNVFFDRNTDMNMGYVRWDEDGLPEKRAKLRHETCEGLLQFMAAPDDLATDRQAKILAVHILSHEARHMVGELREDAAECQALQRNARVARALGASDAAARELAVAYWKEFYPRMPAGYFTPDCRPGGRLDEKLADAPWNLAR
jgi:hypothetical protein